MGEGELENQKVDYEQRLKCTKDSFHLNQAQWLEP